jgi:hypothetical protein
MKVEVGWDLKKKNYAQRLKRKGSAIANVDGDDSKAVSKTSMPSFNLPWPRRATAKLLTACQTKKRKRLSLACACSPLVYNNLDLGDSIK